jgi:hypothetical protein
VVSLDTNRPVNVHRGEILVFLGGRKGQALRNFMVKNPDNVVCICFSPDKKIALNITPLLMHCATSLKVAGSIPDDAIVFFQLT